MQEKKYKSVDASKEDQEAFGKGLSELLEKLSLTLNLSIIKKGISIKLDNGALESGFMDSPTLMLQKKIEISEVESPYIDKKDESISED